MQPVSFRRAAAASFLILGLAQTEGAILVLEQFNYTAGGIAGLNGGTGFTGAFTGVGSVTAPGLQFPNLLTVVNKLTTASANGGAFRTINPIDTNSGTIWVSFLESTNGTVADYAGMSFYNGGTEELFLGKPSSTTNYGFDVSGVAGGANNSAAAPALATASFLLYRISFSAAGETIDFFANNTPGTTPTTPTVTFSIPEGSFASTFNNLRFQSGNQAANFDEVRIGTTYADVSPVPEPASVGVLGAAVLALAGLRRRRA